jgi:tRNA(Ile)-lysidine synthase
MLTRVQRTAYQFCQLSADSPLLLGVSGGADSLCLLDVLAQTGIPLVAAHLDHGLRAESAQDAQVVAQMAAERGARFIMQRVDVAGLARREKRSLEEAGRQARYAFLFEQAKLVGAQAVAVAHTADDQVETLLMHLLRGAGPAGLRGMAFRALPNPWSDRLPLVRPLLGEWRNEIVAYLQERGLAWREDASNQSPRFYRNRLRHELIPYLEGSHPRLKQRLWQTALLAGEEYALVQIQVEAAWERCRVGEESGRIAFDRAAFLAEASAVQRYLVRRAMSRLRPGLRDLSFQTVERALRLAHSAPGARPAQLLAGLAAGLGADRFWIAEEGALRDIAGLPRLEALGEIPLAVPGVTPLGSGWTITCSVLSAGEAKPGPAEPPGGAQAWLDAEALGGALVVRRRRPGERFQPLGMGGHSLKLSDYMINRKIPAAARADWPLVACGSRLAWVAGVQIAEPYRITSATRRALVLTLEAPSGG